MKSVDVFQTALAMVSGTWSLAPVSAILATEVTHVKWNCVTWTVETMATVRVVHVSVTRVGMVKHVESRRVMLGALNMVCKTHKILKSAASSTHEYFIIVICVTYNLIEIH